MGGSLIELSNKEKVGYVINRTFKQREVGWVTQIAIEQIMTLVISLSNEG
jgi:hypothetical protein